MAENGVVEVFLIKTADRNMGIVNLLRQFDLKEFYEKNVALKANFNSADPYPASTHINTLEVLVKNLQESGINSLIMAERSGMSNTRKVLEDMGVFELALELDFDVIVLDELSKDEWTKIPRDGTHWLRGFFIPKVFMEADKVVQTCCLKTHRFGGHFTLSLKNSVGLVAKRVPGGIYNYMAELHLSPYQRLMIAEINKFYDVDLVIMDAMKAFVNMGPEQGKVVEPRLLLACRDRVAVDAVGIAILRSYQTTKDVMKGRIFELDQIRRAAELGVGVKSASKIKIIPIDPESREDAEKIENILEDQG